MNSDQVVATEIHVVWPRTRPLPLKVRVTVDALIGEMPKLLGYAADAGRDRS